MHHAPSPTPLPRTRSPDPPKISLFFPFLTTIFVLSSLSWVSSSACARQEGRFWSEGDWKFPIWLVTIDPGPKATVREVAAAVRSRCKAGSTDEVPTNQPRWPTMEEDFAGWWFSHSNKQGAQSRSSVESSGVQRSRQSRARGFFACQEEAKKPIVEHSFARFRQVGESFGGPRGHLRSRGP